MIQRKMKRARIKGESGQQEDPQMVEPMLAEMVEEMGEGMEIMNLLTILLSIPLIITMAEAVEGPQPMLEEHYNLDTCPMGQNIPSLFMTS